MSSQYDSLMNSINERFNSGLIASNIEYCDSNDLHSAMIFAKVNRFDQVFVKDPISQNLQVIEFNPNDNFAFVNPSKPLRDISPLDICSDSTCLRDIISHMAKTEKSFLVVVSKLESLKIITRADLNKLAVRSYIYILLAHFEDLLAKSITKACPRDAWLNLLSMKNQEKINTLFASKIRNCVDTGKIDCTTITQKLTVFHKNPFLKNCLLGKFGTMTSVDNQINQFIRFRNRLAHNQGPIMGQRNDVDAMPSDERLDGLENEPGIDRFRNEITHPPTVFVYNTQSLKDLDRCLRNIDEWIEIIQALVIKV